MTKWFQVALKKRIQCHLYYNKMKYFRTTYLFKQRLVQFLVFALKRMNFAVELSLDVDELFLQSAQGTDAPAHVRWQRRHSLDVDAVGDSR